MFRVTDGPARERLNAEDVARLRATGSLIVDERRTRPLYFDGRFLTARDLTRDQNYILTRQGDMGRATGSGIVQGLEVRSDPGGLAVTITAGHGLAATGELVILDQDQLVALADVPEMQRLDASFGLLGVPREAARTRTGLFCPSATGAGATALPT